MVGRRSVLCSIAQRRWRRHLALGWPTLCRRLGSAWKNRMQIQILRIKMGLVARINIHVHVDANASEGKFLHATQFKFNRRWNYLNHTSISPSLNKYVFFYSSFLCRFLLLRGSEACMRPMTLAVNHGSVLYSCTYSIYNAGVARYILKAALLNFNFRNVRTMPVCIVSPKRRVVDCRFRLLLLFKTGTSRIQGQCQIAWDRERE